MRSVKRWAAAAVLVASACRSPRPALQHRSLASGRTIDVLKLETVPGAGPSHYTWLEYRSDAKTADDLKREIGEVWATERAASEKAAIPLVFIDATASGWSFEWDGIKPTRVRREKG